MKTRTQLNPGKKRLFTLLMVLTPIFLLLLLELFLQLFKYGGDLRLFVTGPEQQISHFWMCNQYVSNRYFYTLGSTPSPPKDLFLKEKPANGYRIFVLGESTTAGFPYSYNLMFPRILNFQLADLFPDRHIEVVNTAMSAVNSYTLLDFMDEILAQQPDAILIYTGHNEYYGALGVGSQETFSKNPDFIYAYLKLKKFKTFLLVRDVVGLLKKGANKAATGDDIDPSNTLMARIVREQSIPFKGELYNRGLRQFEENMRRILQKAKAAGVPVILSELVCNVKDQPPFVSVAEDTMPTASKAFAIGTQLLKQGDYTDAKTALTYAKDLDALRFRAPEEFNSIIHQLGQEFSAPVVPMQEYFESNSQNGIIGNELILEHVHPNAKGYFLMAEAFLQTMQKNNFISDSWDLSRFRPTSELLPEWAWTELDTAYANLSIHYLKGGWPFQPKVAPNHALENYFPKTHAESLSVRILTDKKFSLVVGHVSMAEYYEKKRQYDKAYDEYRAAFYTIPYEMEFYEKAVANLMRLNRFDDALRDLRISSRYGSTPFTNKWLGQLLAQAGQYAVALPFLEKAQPSLPDDKQLLASLGASYAATGQADQANAIRQKLGSKPTEPADAEPVAMTRPEPASKAGDNTALIYAALIRKAQELLQARRYKDALPLLLKAHEINATPFTYRWIGLIELNLGRVAQSVTYLEKVIELNPNDFEVYYNLCNAYILLGQKDQAGGALKVMENLRPNFSDPQNLRGRAAAL